MEKLKMTNENNTPTWNLPFSAQKAFQTHTTFFEYVADWRSVQYHSFSQHLIYSAMRGKDWRSAVSLIPYATNMTARKCNRYYQNMRKLTVALYEIKSSPYFGIGALDNLVSELTEWIKNNK